LKNIKLTKKEIVSIVFAGCYGLIGIFLNNLLLWLALNYFWLPIFKILYIILPVFVYVILRIIAPNKSLYIPIAFVSNVIFFFLAMDVLCPEPNKIFTTVTQFFIGVFLCYLVAIAFDFIIYRLCIRRRKKRKRTSSEPPVTEENMT
jgi:hypothetical protein